MINQSGEIKRITKKMLNIYIFFL